MNCPSCKQGTLAVVELEPGLKARQCKKCDGNWITSTDYWKDVEQHRADPAATAEANGPWEVVDTRQVKLCPDCGRFLRPYRVGHGLDFRLDHCGHCDGVWFDRNEWQTLLSRGLHHKVHEFFTDYYQNQVLREEFRARLEKIYAEKFGAPDYEKIKSIKDWIDNHPLRRIILSFLQDEDPYED